MKMPSITLPARLSVETAADEVERFIAEQIPRIAYPSGEFAGRGVVIAAGGMRYLTCAWVAINMLRRLGCRLPIEVWYLGRQEKDERWEELVRPLGVTCVDAHQVRDASCAHRRLFGWELKPFAVMMCRFREVLFLDADNVPVLDPEFLFETPQFQQVGAIFWPDYGSLSRQRLAWKIFGNVPYRREPEVESGQIVIDKQRHWPALLLAHFMMQYSDFVFQHVHGDKEVFHLAWRRVSDYAMPKKRIVSLPGVMCQHDFRGRRVFQHRNMQKWSLWGNPETRGFIYEADCVEMLAKLLQLWRPHERLIGEIKEADRQLMAAVAATLWDYRRVGYDSRPMSFSADGLVRDGRAGCERLWWIKDGRLVISNGEGRVTARLRQQEDGAWTGRWTHHERMPVELVPIRPRR